MDGEVCASRRLPRARARVRAQEGRGECKRIRVAPLFTVGDGSGSHPYVLFVVELDFAYIGIAACWPYATLVAHAGCSAAGWVMKEGGF